jgi:hypothetical protein
VPRVARVALGGALVVGAVAACVEIATGPGGVESVRMATHGHAIIAGDVLRDSNAAPAPLHALAFDGSGNVVADAPFRYFAIPVRVDTTTVTNALSIDSMTGAVKAPTPRAARVGRIAAQLGGRLQVVDTLFVVLTPKTLARAVATTTSAAPSPGDSVRRLAFVCTDALTSRPDTITDIDSSKTPRDTAFVGNFIPIATLLTADSAGTAVPVPSYYVRYDVIPPAGFTIPTVTINGVTRPAIGMIRDPQSDRTTPFDTTDAQGISSAAVRIFPRALGTLSGTTPTVFTVRAVVRRTPTDSLAPVLFSVQLRRLTNARITGTPITCPAP